MIKLVVPGRAIPAVRMTQKSKYTKQAKRYLQYKGAVGLIARSEYKHKPTSEKVSVHLSVYLAGGNQGDIDNYFKSVTDSLNKIIYEDDRQIVNAEIDKIECAKGEERIEVEILEVERVV